LVQRERDKLVDADAKIKAIEEALVKLGWCFLWYDKI
jgi:hypothetical protein